MDRPSKIAFIDTETTGLSHLSRPWEVAVILRELASEKSGYVETEHLFQIEYDWHDLPDGTDKDALWIGGWKDRGRRGSAAGRAYRDPLIDQGVQTAAGPEWSIAASLHKLLAGATLVGIGTHYDAEVLGRMFLRHGLDWHPWHYDIQDCKTLTRGYLRAVGRDDESWGGSESLAAAVGVTPPTDEERHTALGDARWARRWFDAL